MANGAFRIKKSVNISSGGTGTESGDLTVNSNELEFHNGSSAKKVATETNTVTLSNKTLDNSTVETIKDANFTLQDDVDITKQAKFQLSGISAGQTRTYTVPDASTTVVGTDTTQTLTNKTLSGNTASSLVNGSGTINFNSTGTITVPNATDTLVAKNTTDTLTNKTLDNSNAATLKDTLFTLQDDGDATKQAQFQLSGITAGQTRTYTVPDASTSLVGTDTSQTLTNKTISRASNTLSGYTSNAVLIADGSGNATSEATLAVSRGGTNIGSYTTGDMLYASSSTVLSKLAIGSANQVIKSVAGIPTWSAAPTGGVNYISGNPDAEGDTSGWSTYADAAQNIPVDATGGSPNSTWTRSTSSPLRGTASFLWTKSGSANRQGEGVAYAFTLDSADEAKPLAITFDYEVASGTFVASNGITAPLNDGTTSTNAGNSDLEVFIYDVTNAVLLPVSPEVLTSNSSTVPSTFKGVFQTSSNSTSYRLIIHTATTSTSNYTVKFDNFFVGPQSVSYGPPVSDFVPYTPTFTGLGTVSGVSAYYRRVGDTLSVTGKVISGTVAAETVSISLPSGFSLDTNKLTANITNLFGFSSRSGTATNTIPAAAYGPWPLTDNISNSTTAVYVATQSSTSTATSYTLQNGNAILNNNDALNFTFTVPITGWSSTVLMSNDTDTRVVAASYYLNSDTAFNSTTINYDTKNYDTHSAVTTGASWKFTTPVSGFYKIIATAYFSSGSASDLVIRKNGTNYARIAQVQTTGTPSYLGSIGINLVSGDTIDVVTDASITFKGLISSVQTTYIAIERVSGPSAIAATESVNARYYASATSISGSLATISWTTKDYDSHGGMSSGTYTVPTSGKYQVNSAILLSGTIALNSTLIMEIQKNGSVVSRFTEYAGGAETNMKGIISDIINCSAGDTLRIQVSSSITGPSIVSSNFDNYISLSRVGN